jgi:hypothetical protein
MISNDLPATQLRSQIRLAFNNYVYGFDSVMDIIYKKYRTLESIVALVKGEVEQFNISPVIDARSPAVFEFVEFLKTNEGVRVANKWLATFKETLWEVEILAIRLLLNREPFSSEDQIMLCDTIDIAINSLTKDVVIKERLSRTPS